MSGRFDKGILYYTKGTAHIDVFFPEDEVKCKYCPFLRFIDGVGQYRCRLTEKIIFSPEIIGVDCPIKFEGEVLEGKENV